MTEFLSFLAGTTLGYVLHRLSRHKRDDVAELRQQLEVERRLRREQEIRHQRFRARVALAISKSLRGKSANPLDESKKKR